MAPFFTLHLTITDRDNESRHGCRAALAVDGAVRIALAGRTFGIAHGAGGIGKIVAALTLLLALLTLLPLLPCSPCWHS